MQQKVSIVINETLKFEGATSTQTKQESLETAFTSIILNHSDVIFCQVNDETIALRLWNKLEALYLRKTLSNNIYLKKKLFGHKMETTKTLEANLDANLDDFNKVTIELSNIGEVVSDKNQAVFLLNSLPETFDAIRAAIEYGREDLSLGVGIYSEIKGT